MHLVLDPGSSACAGPGWQCLDPFCARAFLDYSLSPISVLRRPSLSAGIGKACSSTLLLLFDLYFQRHFLFCLGVHSHQIYRHPLFKSLSVSGSSLQQDSISISGSFVHRYYSKIASASTSLVVDHIFTFSVIFLFAWACIHTKFIATPCLSASLGRPYSKIASASLGRSYR